MQVQGAPLTRAVRSACLHASIEIVRQLFRDPLVLRERPPLVPDALEKAGEILTEKMVFRQLRHRIRKCRPDFRHGIRCLQPSTDRIQLTKQFGKVKGAAHD